MNHHEFLEELSCRLGYAEKENAARQVSALAEIIAEELQEGLTIDMDSLGTLGVEKRLEKIIVNPLTGQRFLVPPELVVKFEPGAGLDEEFKNKRSDE